MCNVNQVEASFLMEHGFHGNLSQTSALFDEYISGKKGGLTEDQKKQLESLISSSWYLKEILAFAPITVLARQTCRNMFLQVSYRGKSMYWRQFDDLTLGPYYYGTDYGACCFFNGEINMKKWPINTTEVQVRIKMSLKKLHYTTYSMYLFKKIEVSFRSSTWGQ